MGKLIVKENFDHLLFIELHSSFVLEEIYNKLVRRASFLLLFLCSILLCLLIPLFATNFWFSIVSIILIVISKLWIPLYLYVIFMEEISGE